MSVFHETGHSLAATSLRFDENDAEIQRLL